MSDNSELPQNDITPDASKEEETKVEKTYDFWLGFFGALLVNILLYILITLISIRNISYTQVNVAYLVVPLLINFGAIIWFSVKMRFKIVNGILVVASIAFLFSLCRTTECFFGLI